MLTNFCHGTDFALLVYFRQSTFQNLTPLRRKYIYLNLQQISRKIQGLNEVIQKVLRNQLRSNFTHHFSLVIADFLSTVKVDKNEIRGAGMT